MTVESQTFFDFELCFSRGHVIFLTVQDGRDTVAMDEQRIKITLRPSDSITEEYLVYRRELASEKITKRIVEPEYPLAS